MNCPLCKEREVTDLAAIERVGYRFVCSFCLAEAYKAERRKVWPCIVEAPAVLFFAIEEVERIREVAA
jgi:hypothetical protein